MTKLANFNPMDSRTNTRSKAKTPRGIHNTCSIYHSNRMAPVHLELKLVFQNLSEPAKKEKRIIIERLIKSLYAYSST